MELELEIFLKAGQLLSSIWEREKVKNYPSYLPSFDEFLTDFGNLLGEKEIGLSKIQKKMLKEKCPHCKVGNMREVQGSGTENYLWCDNCDCSVDSSGGYTH